MENLGLILIFLLMAFFVLRRGWKEHQEQIKSAKNERGLIKSPPTIRLTPKQNKKVSPNVAHKDQGKAKINQVNSKSSIQEKPFQSNSKSFYEDQYGERVGKIDLRFGKSAKYETIHMGLPSKGANFMKRLQNKQEMVIFSEIFGLPRGFKEK
jgi:hypothetical protein